MNRITHIIDRLSQNVSLKDVQHLAGDANPGTTPLGRPGAPDHKMGS